MIAKGKKCHKTVISNNQIKQVQISFFINNA
jgi:hypothetical protein